MAPREIPGRSGWATPSTGNQLDAPVAGAKVQSPLFQLLQLRGTEPGFRDAAHQGNITDLERSLNQIVGDLAAAPVSGIVLMTDGADNHSADLTAAAAQFRARNLPLYTVGIGASGFSRDTEVVRVTVPKKVLEDTLVEAEVTVRSVGYPGNGHASSYGTARQLQSQEITLGSDGEVKTYKIHFSSQSAGPRCFGSVWNPSTTRSFLRITIRRRLCGRR